MNPLGGRPRRRGRRPPAGGPPTARPAPASRVIADRDGRMNTELGMGETGVAWDLWLSGAVAAAALGVLAVALWRRWFAGLRDGLGVAVMLSLVGAGVLTALVLGTWAYHEARAAVFDQTREGLENVGRVAESE